MATLNSKETEILRDVLNLLDFISRKGFDPESDNQNDILLKKKFSIVKSNLKSVIAIKGFYPK